MTYPTQELINNLRENGATAVKLSIQHTQSGNQHVFVWGGSVGDYEQFLADRLDGASVDELMALRSALEDAGFRIAMESKRIIDAD